MESGSLRILVKTNRRRSVFVHEKDIDLLMLVLHNGVERFGVPPSGIPDEASALADAPEWFDSRTSRWYVREGQVVHTSQPVPRTTGKGIPLDVETFKRKKEEMLEALRAKVGSRIAATHD